MQVRERLRLNESLTFVVQGAEGMKEFQRHNHALDRRSVHEVKIQKIVDTHGFQLDKRTRQVRPLDFGNRRGQHLVTVGSFCVQPKSLTRTCPPCTTRSLLRLSLNKNKRPLYQHGATKQLEHPRKEARQAGILKWRTLQPITLEKCADLENDHVELSLPSVHFWSERDDIPVKWA